MTSDNKTLSNINKLFARASAWAAKGKHAKVDLCFNLAEDALMSCDWTCDMTAKAAQTLVYNWPAVASTATDIATVLAPTKPPVTMVTAMVTATADFMAEAGKENIGLWTLFAFTNRVRNLTIVDSGCTSERFDMYREILTKAAPTGTLAYKVKRQFADAVAARLPIARILRYGV